MKTDRKNKLHHLTTLEQPLNSLSFMVSALLEILTGCIIIVVIIIIRIIIVIIIIFIINNL